MAKESCHNHHHAENLKRENGDLEDTDIDCAEHRDVFGENKQQSNTTDVMRKDLNSQLFY